MNKGTRLKIDRAVGVEALRILRAIPDLDVALEAAGPHEHRGNAVIQHGGSETLLDVKFRRRVDAAVAHNMIRHAPSKPDITLLVVAAETTAAARQILAEADVGYVDAFGNARLELPGLILRLTGTGKPPPTRPRATLSGKSGLVAQALLLDPDRSWHIKDLRVSPAPNAPVPP